MMDNFIKKYGSYLLPITVGALALYDRFIVIELENELNKKDFQRQIEHIKKDLKNELQDIKDHELRIRKLECKQH
jgi:hypothetical protein